jgi:hypothetical protein
MASLASLIYLDIEFWLFTAPVALGLALLAWHGPKRLDRFRWVALTVAIVMATPLSLGAMLRVYKFPRERTLYHDEIVAGQSLYAGSKIRFRDFEHTYIDQIELPRVTNISGIPFTGTVSFDSGGDNPARWYGTLATDHTISGWPCAGGKIATRWGSKLLMRCQLATAHVFFDFELPAGTMVNYDWPKRGVDTWDLDLPPDKGLAIKALSTTAPGGVALRVTGDGRLREINLKAGQTIVVRGVPLRGRSVMVRDTVAGEIAEAFVIAGEQRPIGTKVSIDLAETGWQCRGGTIRLRSERSLWSCELASGQSYFEYDLPAGMRVKYDGDATWLAYSPDQEVVIKILSTTAPSGPTLKVTSDGSLKEISLRAGQTMMIRGVPLKGEIEVYEQAVYGDTAGPFVVAGEQQPVDTPVKIDLVTGTVSLNRPNCVCPQ